MGFRLPEEGDNLALTIRYRSVQRKLMRPLKRFVILSLLACLGGARAEAGFRSPESLARNVYAYYGNGASELSKGLPRDPETARQFFDPGLRDAWTAPRDAPYDFLVQSPTWKLGPVSTTILRKQFDKTYVAVSFDNHGRPSPEFHRRQRPRRLGDFGCRKPARLASVVPRPVPTLTNEKLL